MAVKGSSRSSFRLGGKMFGEVEAGDRWLEMAQGNHNFLRSAHVFGGRTSFSAAISGKSDISDVKKMLGTENRAMVDWALKISPSTAKADTVEVRTLALIGPIVCFVGNLGDWITTAQAPYVAFFGVTGDGGFPWSLLVVRFSLCLPFGLGAFCCFQFCLFSSGGLILFVVLTGSTLLSLLLLLKVFFNVQVCFFPSMIGGFVKSTIEDAKDYGLDRASP